MELIKVTTTNNHTVYINPEKISSIVKLDDGSWNVYVEADFYNIKENIIEIYDAHYKKFYEDLDSGYVGCVIE